MTKSRCAVIILMIAAVILSAPPAWAREITLTNEEPFAYVYIIWDGPPSDWTLEIEGSLPIERNSGFLHELVTLERPVNEAVIKTGDTNVREVYYFAEGELPGWVQQWEPVLDKADLLVLPTHADDEHLFFGGILPTYAGERGLNVQVAYMTSHWGEPVRPHELLNGLWEVGVTNYPYIGPFVDLYASKESLAAAERVYGRERVLEYQVWLIRRFQPLVVVGHDLKGEYGHGAHILNAVTLVEAIELAADPAAFPESAELYGVWDTPKTYLHLYPENALVMDWNIPLERFGGATGFEMAVAGFAKHVSQQAYFSVQQGGTWEDCRKFGLVRSTVGPDVEGGDLFENIVFRQPPEPEPEPEVEPEAEPETEPETEPEPEIPEAAPTENPDENPETLYRRYVLYILAIILIALIALSLLRGRAKK